MSSIKFILVGLLLSISSRGGHAAEPKIQSRFFKADFVKQAKGYRPLRASFGSKLDTVKVMPEDLEEPKVGEFSFGDRSWLFVIDEPKDQPARLFVDTNGDGDLTNDPEPEYSLDEERGSVSHKGYAKLQWDQDQLVQIGMYRFDPAKQNRESLKNAIMYYADFGYVHTLTMDGKTYTEVSTGPTSSRQGFRVDRDGNDDIHQKLEVIRVGTPFNFTGTTYVLSLTNGKLSIDEASEPIEKTPLPLDLSVGQPAVEFSSKTMEGKEVNFPSDYKGKIVLLDFWATWCGPCIGEFPHLKEAQDEWGDKGFSILSVNLDREGRGDRLKETMERHEVQWDLIYEGEAIGGRLASIYDITSIPFVLLVDGDTGKIMATRRQLRGARLSESIAKALGEKSGSSSKD